MRRRQLFAQREHELMMESEKQKEDAMKVPNSNLISNTAQKALKEKAKMFLADENDIVKPNASPYRKKGSKPGARAKDSTRKENKY